jgi:hypothetical protein
MDYELRLSYDIEIPVTQTYREKGTNSLCYSMTRNPRGKCIILNNEPKLFIESKRFEFIFKELCFDVETVGNNYKMTTEEMLTKLKFSAENEIFSEHQALVVMIISRGEDEKIFGFNACRKADDEKRDQNDVIDISEIVDIFSEKKCFALRGKPKMFFFNCSQISITLLK